MIICIIRVIRLIAMLMINSLGEDSLHCQVGGTGFVKALQVSNLEVQGNA